MRLSEIKLAGFKSFVDPTVIPVPGNLVGIVGPNGCGKSNVIDAVRWVLGESRASALRGESLQDVIFNGSANRKPVGRASVELVFDNASGKVTGQWGAYNEISIKRVMQKDGESAYYINNIHVRRRDIADIFLGTGVSGRGYAIIEQGMISRIIEAKPQELRIFLEEAAGISKYRERRHETGLRLTDARSNLLRLDDILEELDKQSRHLEEQGKVATRYQTLHAQLLAAQHALWIQHKRLATKERDKTRAEIKRLAQELETIQADLQGADKKLEALRARHRVVNDQQHRLQGELYATDGEIARIEQDVRHMRENKARLESQAAEAKYRLQDHAQQSDDLAEELMSWKTKLAQVSELHAALKAEYSLAVDKLPQMESAAQADRTEWSRIKEKLQIVRQNEKLQQNQLAHCEKTLHQLTLRQQRLLDEQRNQPAVDHERLAELEQENSEFSILMAAQQQLLSQREARLHAAQQEVDRARQAVQKIQREITQAKARHDTLQHLQSQLESNHDLNTWVTQNQLDTLPRLWQQIQIEVGWETALEAILRERIQAVSMDRLEQVLDWGSRLPPGKWSACERVCERVTMPHRLAQTAHSTGQTQRDWKPLSALLSYRDSSIQPVLETWLSGVFVIDGIESGLLVRSLLAPGEMLVTADGHTLTRYSVSYFAPDSALHGVLSRRQEIERIAAECEKLEDVFTSNQLILSRAEQSCRELAAGIAQVRVEIERLRTAQHQQQIQIVRLTKENERLTQRQYQLEKELAELFTQISEELSQKQQIEILSVNSETEKNELEMQLQQAESACQLSEQALATHLSLVQRLATELREAAFSEVNCHGKIADCEQRLEMIARNKESLSETLHNLELTQAEFDESSLLDSLTQWQARRTVHEQTLTAVWHELAEVDRALLESEQVRMHAEQRLHPCREAISEARLKEQEAVLTERQFIEKLIESGVDEHEVSQEMGNEQPARLQTRINRLNQDIAALGAVNLAALQELRELQERRMHLDQQSQDLQEAIHTLENAMRQIDRETRERLLETFNQVNSNLVELFASIFGGGHAGLVLGGEDILDAGVQLNAQPPGKKNSSIHLLSGGEKALTALALVFSLFKLNPAPFCLLDEVDAPLDDSNSSRFCELVKRMAGETQFLFISHNKITMQMARQLVGVTMREQGVSRVVTVDIEKMAAAGNEARHV